MYNGAYRSTAIAWTAILVLCHVPLTRYVILRVAHTPGMPGTFSPPPRDSDPDMHHSTCVTHVLWCMPGSLASSFLWSRWRGNRTLQKCDEQVRLLWVWDLRISSAISDERWTVDPEFGAHMGSTPTIDGTPRLVVGTVPIKSVSSLRTTGQNHNKSVLPGFASRWWLGVRVGRSVTNQPGQKASAKQISLVDGVEQ